MRKLFLAAVCAATIVGCSTSHVLVGTKRAPISPDQVQIYLQPPAKFESVAMLEASSMGSGAFTNQQKTDKVMARLKQEAAKLGANGVLLQGVGNQSGPAVVSGQNYGGGFSGVAVPVMHKSGTAVAIYVEP